MKQRNKAVPASYLILEKEGKFLVSRRCNTGYQDGNYQVPAGHVDEGELPSEALIREAKEEIGIELKPADIELVHVAYRPKHDQTGDRVDFFFRAKSWKGEVTNMETDKCDDLRWVSPAEIPKNMNPCVRDAILAANKGIFFSEFGIDYLKRHALYKI
jgi:8-oxo-dGTP pyrophosphatase MutT (NUDIX family)